MAYGLDFEEIYYTDHERYDLGVLETYEISIDLADEKDFKIESPDPVIPIGGFWYIQDTEYGGIVDSFYTNSDDESIEYEGRSFRGILDSHIVDVVGKEMTIPQNATITVDQDGAIDDDNTLLVATISDCFRELVTDFGDLFVVDEPDINEDVSAIVSNYTIKAGTTVYEAMMGLADSIDFTFTLQYKSDKRIHITPILIQDYTDYLKGSKYEGLGFQTEITAAVVNHLISTAYDEETGEIYRIHFFADENGGLQPYATVDKPIKDSQYILDKRNQVLFGIDEITEYQETGVTAIETPEMLTSPPSDWAWNFAAYYKHEFIDEYSAVTHPEGNPKAQGWYEKDGDDYFPTQDISVSIGKQYYIHSVNEEYGEFEAVGEEVYTAVTSQPSDWASNYSSYYIRSTDDTTGEYVYTAVSGETALDYSSIVAITSQPSDWTSNYSEYYYKFQTGTGIEYRSYQGESKNNYVRMTAKPDDWDTNFSSYFRKVYEKKVKGKTKLIDTVDHKDAKYVACAADDDKKNGRVPSFSKRAHYRNDPIEVPPNFLKNNCYRIRKTEVAPTWNAVANRYFKMTMQYHAPKFNVGEAYDKVIDHYADMAKDAVEFFKDEKRKSSQRMDLEDFVVNIGDIVGGTDEYTKTSVVGNITNIEATIENGLIDVSYSITVEDYTTSISAKRQAEEEE